MSNAVVRVEDDTNGSIGGDGGRNSTSAELRAVVVIAILYTYVISITVTIYR